MTNETGDLNEKFSSNESTRPTVSSTYTEDASLSRRVMAFLLDGLILSIPLAVGTHMVPFLGGFLVWFFYGPIFEASDLRATPGKYLMGIQVVDEQGRKLSFRSSVLRNMLKLLSTCLLFFGCLVALFTRRKQAFHDIFAETFVVYGRTEIHIGEAWLAAVKDFWGDRSTMASRGASSKKSFSPQDTEMKESQFPNGESSSQFVSELERLHGLRQSGALTDEEFVAAKKKILENL